jgi:TonB family protein
LLASPFFKEAQEKVIEVFDQKDLDSNQKVVFSSKAKDQSKTEKETDFLGEFHQRVERQSQSPLKGRFEQGVSKGQELFLGQEKNTNGNQTLQSGELSIGRNPYVLPDDIPFGNETVLNTDKVKYASFLNRIADEIYHPWVELAEAAIQRFRKNDRKIEPNLYITRLKITMDESGEVKGIKVLQSSGITELDEAPKKAFWEVEPFPHPPDQLIEEDGFVRLTYEFQFECKTSFFNIIPSRI